MLLTDGLDLAEEISTANEELAEIMEGRTNFYWLLARVFAREADGAFLAALRDQKELLGAIRGISRRGQGLLRDFFQRTGAKSIGDVAADLAVEYAGLFLGAGGRQGRPARPYASVYLSRDGCLMQEPYSRIADFYNRAGFARSADARELDDHISVVLEFMAHLAEGTVRALKNREDRSVRERLRLQDAFLRDNVLTWVPAFCQDAARYADSEFYRAFAAITSAFVKADEELLQELLQEMAVEDRQ